MLFSLSVGAVATMRAWTSFTGRGCKLHARTRRHVYVEEQAEEMREPRAQGSNARGKGCSTECHGVREASLLKDFKLHTSFSARLRRFAP
jgi:hypothetical protein